MGLNVGDPIPVVDIPLRVGDEFTTINTGEISKGKRIVIFALPGAFTPTCSTQQLPGFEENYGKFQEKGIDEVYCLSVNDSFVMNAWFKDLGIENVKSLPDGARSFTMSIGALCEKNNLGFGFRSWRYAIVVNDGVVENVFSEEGFGNNIETDPYEVSTPENVLDNI
jgi:peroxiredoxin|tara:strand:- start:1059 stop:1559 length:501 start_codon:yes stop_codon:yes gene_type:complete